MLLKLQNVTSAYDSLYHLLVNKDINLTLLPWPLITSFNSELLNANLLLPFTYNNEHGEEYDDKSYLSQGGSQSPDWKYLYGINHDEFFNLSTFTGTNISTETKNKTNFNHYLGEMQQHLPSWIFAANTALTYNWNNIRNRYPDNVIRTIATEPIRECVVFDTTPITTYTGALAINNASTGLFPHGAQNVDVSPLPNNNAASSMNNTNTILADTIGNTTNFIPSPIFSDEWNQVNNFIHTLHQPFMNPFMTEPKTSTISIGNNHASNFSYLDNNYQHPSRIADSNLSIHTGYNSSSSLNDYLVQPIIIIDTTMNKFDSLMMNTFYHKDSIPTGIESLMEPQPFDLPVVMNGYNLFMSKSLTNSLQTLQVPFDFTMVNNNFFKNSGKIKYYVLDNYIKNNNRDNYYQFMDEWFNNLTKSALDSPASSVHSPIVTIPSQMSSFCINYWAKINMDVHLHIAALPYQHKTTLSSLEVAQWIHIVSISPLFNPSTAPITPKIYAPNNSFDHVIEIVDNIQELELPFVSSWNIPNASNNANETSSSFICNESLRLLPYSGKIDSPVFCSDLYDTVYPGVRPYPLPVMDDTKGLVQISGHSSQTRTLIDPNLFYNLPHSSADELQQLTQNLINYTPMSASSGQHMLTYVRNYRNEEWLVLLQAIDNITIPPIINNTYVELVDHPKTPIIVTADTSATGITTTTIKEPEAPEVSISSVSHPTPSFSVPVMESSSDKVSLSTTDDEGFPHRNILLLDRPSPSFANESNFSESLCTKLPSYTEDNDKQPSASSKQPINDRAIDQLLRPIHSTEELFSQLHEINQLNSPPMLHLTTLPIRIIVAESILDNTALLDALRTIGHFELIERPVPAPISFIINEGTAIVYVRLQEFIQEIPSTTISSGKASAATSSSLFRTFIRHLAIQARRFQQVFIFVDAEGCELPSYAKRNMVATIHHPDAASSIRLTAEALRIYTMGIMATINFPTSVFWHLTRNVRNVAESIRNITHIIIRKEMVDRTVSLPSLAKLPYCLSIINDYYSRSWLTDEEMRSEAFLVCFPLINPFLAIRILRSFGTLSNFCVAEVDKKVEVLQHYMDKTNIQIIHDILHAIHKPLSILPVLSEEYTTATTYIASTTDEYPQQSYTEPSIGKDDTNIMKEFHNASSTSIHTHDNRNPHYISDIPVQSITDASIIHKYRWDNQPSNYNEEGINYDQIQNPLPTYKSLVVHPYSRIPQQPTTISTLSTYPYTSNSSNYIPQFAPPGTIDNYGNSYPISTAFQSTYAMNSSLPISTSIGNNQQSSMVTSLTHFTLGRVYNDSRYSGPVPTVSSGSSFNHQSFQVHESAVSYIPNNNNMGPMSTLSFPVNNNSNPPSNIQLSSSFPPYLSNSPYSRWK